MVRLELTLAEARQLQHWLTDTHPSVPESLNCLPTKLAEALNNATQRRHCPVCQQGFRQEQRGRTGRYCSAACKQKAYRRRQLERRKAFVRPKPR
jgi:predicted nucleic acid-binding Zn ribbon protein